MRRMNTFAPLMRSTLVKSLLKFAVQQRVQSPTQAQRDNNPSFVWGEARNAAGRVVTARMRTANGYTLTVQSSLGILAEVFAGVPDPGFTTPALLVGPDFASSLPGSTPIRLDS